MKLPEPLIEGRLVKRYKRFLADVTLGRGPIVTAHCPNPGAMLGLDRPGARVWLSRSDDPRRKLAHTLELVEADGGLVGIHTGRPNALVAEALAAGLIEPAAPAARVRREVPYGSSSRVDFVVETPDGPPLYLEVKNVHLMREPGLAEFPDCVTARGAKHLRDLAEVAENGGRAKMVYVIQRTDCDRFTLARDLDPGYAEAFAEARARGVEAAAYRCRVGLGEIAIDRPVAFDA